MAYGKLFESMFTGSMVGSGPLVFSVWAYVIANAKPPGIVEINPKILAFILGCTEEDVTDTVGVLCSPDPDSRTPDHEGRRLIPDGPFMYQVPTWAKYNRIRNDVDRRDQNRESQRRFRQKSKPTVSDVADMSAESAKSAHADADADVDAVPPVPPKGGGRRLGGKRKKESSFS